MKQRLLIALLTVIGFAAGFGARMLTEGCHKACPPPPPVGTEFARTNAVAAGQAAKPDAPPVGISEKDREKFYADIEKVRPQIDSYRKRVDQIYEDFDREFATLLTAEQRVIFDEQHRKLAENRAKRAASEAAQTGPLTDQQIEQLKREPLWSILHAIAVNWRFARITNDYKLTPEQQSKVRPLLETRRQRFLALIDETPPPTISYAELAGRAQKLLTQPKK